MGYAHMAQANCMYQLQTKAYLHRCLPDFDPDEAAKLVSETSEELKASGDLNSSTPLLADSYGTKMNEGTGYFNQMIADIFQLQGYVFGFGLGVSVGVAFLYLYILRLPFFLFVFLWGIIVSILVFLLVGSWLLWALATKWSNDDLHSDVEVLTMRVFSYIGMACTVLYFCLIVVLRKRIQLAIGIVKQACKALVSMPALILLPIIQGAGVIAFLAVWLVYVFYLASSGEIKTITATVELTGGEEITTTHRQFTYTDNTRWAFLYMLFCWFWTSEFIVAMGQLIIALSFTAWYFTREKSNIGNFTVVWVRIMHIGGLMTMISLLYAFVLLIFINTYRLSKLLFVITWDLRRLVH
jgi:hypothetical protein